MRNDLAQWHAAAAEALATIRQARERLEMNDYDGEEQPFIEDCDTAIQILEALPLNRAGIAEYNQRIT